MAQGKVTKMFACDKNEQILGFLDVFDGDRAVTPSTDRGQLPGNAFRPQIAHCPLAFIQTWECDALFQSQMLRAAMQDKFLLLFF